MAKHTQHQVGKLKALSPLHFGVILVAALVLSYVLSRSFAATGTAVFSIEPASGSVVQGTTRELMVYVTPTGSGIQSAQVSVNLPAQLQYQSFDSAGSSFSISAAASGDTVGSSKVTIIGGYTAGRSGTAGTKLYIGKLVTTATTTQGTGSVTLTEPQAQDPAEEQMTVTVSNATVTVSAAPQPDLVITAINTVPATPQAGAATSFSASVKNQGNLATTAGVAHTVKFLVGTSQVMSTNFTSSIAAGATVTINANTGSTWTGSIGNHTVTATVDDGNVITESNESNNQFSRTFTIADTTAPTVSFTFPGVLASETLSNNVITIASLKQAVVRPTVTDNLGVSTTTYKVNNTTVALSSGQYTLPDKNGDYQFNVTATDAAANTLNRTITIKSRYPDISRDGKVSLPDFTKLMLQWGSTNPEADLDANGSVGLGDFTKLLLKWTN